MTFLSESSEGEVGRLLCEVSVRIKLFTDKCETLRMNLAKGKAKTTSKHSENGV
jgi:hypothetical protein